MWYPYNSTKTPNYEITYTFQYVMHFVAMMSYATSDIVFPCFSVIVVGQFDLLG